MTARKHDTMSVPDQSLHLVQQPHHVVHPHLPHLLIVYITSTALATVTESHLDLDLLNLRDARAQREKRNKDRK